MDLARRVGCALGGDQVAEEEVNLGELAVRICLTRPVSVTLPNSKALLDRAAS